MENQYLEDYFGGGFLQIQSAKGQTPSMRMNGIEHTAQQALKDDKFQQLMSARMTEVGDDNHEENKLTSLIDTIDKLKQTLDLDLTVENLNSFKDAVKSFLDFYTKEKMGLEDFYMQDDAGYQKKMRIIRTVDDKVDNLTEHMLETNQGHLTLLKNIGEIHGLVINELW